MFCWFPDGPELKTSLVAGMSVEEALKLVRKKCALEGQEDNFFLYLNGSKLDVTKTLSDYPKIKENTVNFNLKISIMSWKYL